MTQDILIAQKSNIRFRHIKVEDGLSQSWVETIFQDSYGYLWFGTGSNGINKYDGYNFSVYRNDPKEQNSLTNNMITAIYEDRHKTLWVGTQSGLNYYDRERDIMVSQPILTDQFITGFYETVNGSFYIVTVNNIYKLNRKNLNVERYCNTPCLNDIFSGTITPDTYGNLWLASTDGLYLLDTLNYSFTTFKHNNNDPASLSTDKLQYLYLDTQGRMWIGTVDNGLMLMYIKDNDPFQPVFIPIVNKLNDPRSINKGAVRSILDDGEGKLWLGIENQGLSILDLEGVSKGIFSFDHYLNNRNDLTSLSNNSIYSLIKDNQGTIWIGTYGGGVNYFNKLLFQFDHYLNTSENTIINTITKIDNQFWVGTEGGLLILDEDLNLKKVFRHNPNDILSIGSNALWTIFKDSRNNIWLGTWAGGLNRFNSHSNTFKRYLHDDEDPGSIGSDNIFGINEDKDGNLWIATMGGGLNRYDYKTNSFRQYRSDINDNTTISGDWVNTVLVTSGNEIWISSSTGVDNFDRTTGQFHIYRNIPDDPTSISYSNAITIFEDSRNNLWFGTEGGLNAFIREDSSFIYYREGDGMPDNSVKCICEDDHGNLWLSSNKGITKFINAVDRPKKAIFINFDVNDGLQGNEFNRRSCFKDERGYMYFGGTNGISYFHPDSLKKNETAPPVTITDFLLFNKKVNFQDPGSPLSKHISSSEEIVLSYKHSVITFHFAALNFIAPEKNQYKYFLENFDKTWNEVGNKREATYTNLDPGKYTFYVTGSNNDGIWNNTAASVKLTILPPWWKTIWFRILAAMITIGLIMSIYYLRVNELNKQKMLLQETVSQRTQEIEEKNAILVHQTNELNEINTILEERQQRIEEQTEKLLSQAEELKKSNDTLVKLNATKDKFFSIIAHDLKNPFTSILGFCEILILRYDSYDDHKRKHLLGVIEQSAQSVFRLLENLLQWSRSQTGNVKYTPEEFTVDEIYSSILPLVQNTLNEKGITLKHDIPKNLVVFADKNMIYTVLRNLVTNALKFTDGGEVSVNAQVEGDTARITITDTGVGIKPENLDRIFEIEKSKSTEGTRGETGTGLGLIICKEFIEKNKGKIGVMSELGKGSTFFFTLPVRK